MYNHEHFFIVSGKFGSRVKIKHEQINYFLKFALNIYFSLNYSSNNFFKSCVREAIYRQLCLIRTSIFDRKRKYRQRQILFLHIGEYLRLKQWYERLMWLLLLKPSATNTTIYPTGIIRLHLLSVWFCKSTETLQHLFQIYRLHSTFFSSNSTEASLSSTYFFRCLLFPVLDWEIISLRENNFQFYSHLVTYNISRAYKISVKVLLNAFLWQKISARDSPATKEHTLHAKIQSKHNQLTFCLWKINLKDIINAAVK